MASSYGTSSGQSSSTSTSTPTVAPINANIAGLMQQLSGSAQSLANDTYQWATQQFNKSSVVTDQMVNDANTYASQGRIQTAMGQAETDTGQAMDQGRQQAEQQLQSYGIDPSSGRYAALETAQAAQKAAAQAGAGQTARQRTEDTGRQLRAQAINAELAAQNTGAAMKGVANQFLGTAASALKYAPTGQNTTSNSQSSNRSTNSSSSPVGTTQPGGNQAGARPGGAISGGPGGYPSSGSSYFNPANYTEGNSSGSPASGGLPDASIMQVDGGGYDTSGNMYGDIYSGGTQDPQAAAYGGYNTGGDTNPGATDTGGIYDPSASYNSYDQGSGWGDTQASGDTSSGYDPSNTNWGDQSFAAGGAVPADTTTGGQVPQQASPSQGMQTDDVPANLNEGEFVVPRDVAKWKGEEFFQKLIAQSRKARMTAPAAGKPGPAMQGAPRFASQAVGA